MRSRFSLETRIELGKGSGNGSFPWRKDWENRGFPRSEISGREHKTKQIWTSPDFFVLVLTGDIFFSKKIVEVGSWKFHFDENEIIPDHKPFYFPFLSFFAKR